MNNIKRNNLSFTKKVIMIFLAAAVLFTALPMSTLSVSAQGEEDTLVVGMEAAYAPYNWTQQSSENNGVRIENADGYANGYDVQIAKTIAEKIGKKLVIKKYGWDGLIPALEAGQIDVILAGMSDTPERRQNIDFTKSYYKSDMVIVVKKDSPFAGVKTLEDLKGAILTGQLGTIHYDLIDEIEGAVKDPALEDFPTMIVSVNSGRIDGYISEMPGALAAMNSNKDLSYIQFDEGQGFSEQVSVEVGIKKGDDELRDAIDLALLEITEEDKAEYMQFAVDHQPHLGDFDEDSSFWGVVRLIIDNYGAMFLRGASMTLLVSLVGTIIGLLIGIITGAIKTIPYEHSHGKFTLKNVLLKIANVIIFIYVEVFRGTPMMVQAMVIFYGIPTVFKIDGLSVLGTSLFILSINTGAYMTEVVRGGIEGIDKGQTEAGKAVGMTHWQVMKNIVLPQTIRRILPATGNEFVINIKDTSVLNVVTLAELFYNTKVAAAATARSFEPYLISAVIYLFMTVTITQILRFIERKIDGEHHFTRTSSTMPDHKLNEKSYGKKRRRRAGH